MTRMSISAISNYPTKRLLKQALRQPRREDSPRYSTCRIHALPPPAHAALKEKMSRAQGRLYANVGFQGALIDDATELRNMKKSGAIAFKLYLNKSLETFDSSDNTALEHALQAAKECNAIVTVHAEDGAAIRSMQERCIAQGKRTIRDFLRAHAPSVEVSAVRRILAMTKRFGVQAHVCHITIPDSVGVVRRTPNTTCEASAHHLLLNQSVFKKQKTLAICVPPIRGERYREGLWRLFRSGKVDILASDHAPHTLEEKTYRRCVESGFRRSWAGDFTPRLVHSSRPAEDCHCVDSLKPLPPIPPRFFG